MMGCIFSLFETDVIRDEIVYIPGVDFYIEPADDEHEINELFFLYD
jgi:hypothetical protein